MSKRTTFSKAIRQRVYDKYNGRCAYCGIGLIEGFTDCRNEVFHVDHIIPISKGGSNKLINLNPSCAFCNLLKHDLLIEKFRYKLFYTPDYLYDNPVFDRLFRLKYLKEDWGNARFYFERVNK